jgi:Heterokaryon incompatibility protein (HET)
MGDVYSTAQHTIIFLGFSSPQCDTVLQLIATGTRPSGESEDGSNTTPAQLLDEYEAVVEDEILARPWFTRVWILQELVLSQNPWVQCGKFRVRWHLFCRTILSSKSSSWKPESRAVLEHMSDTRLKSITTSQSGSQESEGAPGDSLFNLMQKRRVCGMSDPRDLIYAHLGLVDAETRNIVPIDYAKTVVQVYGDISALYARLIGPGTILSLAAQNRPERCQHSLPSWALDWSLQYLHRDGLRLTSASLWTSYIDLYQRQRRRFREPAFSFIIPHLMAVRDWDLGPIEAIIPASSWPKIGRIARASRTPKSLLSRLYPWYNQGIHMSLLDWVSREDHDALLVRRLLVDFSKKMVQGSKGLKEYIIHFAPSEGPEGTLLTEVISIMSKWPEEYVCGVGGILDETAELWEREVFIRLCFLNLVSLMDYHKGSNRTAVLKDASVLFWVPHSAQIGDHIAGFDVRSYSECAILRPCDIGLSLEEELQIQNDLDPQDIEKTLSIQMSPSPPPVLNCKFISPALDAWRVAQDKARPYYDINVALDKGSLKTRERRIFVIH